jgi:hypothetical protein
MAALLRYRILGPQVAFALTPIHGQDDALRNIDGQPAVFLRYGNAGYVVIGVDGREQTIERSDWLALPPWIPVPPKTPSGWIDY